MIHVKFQTNFYRSFIKGFLITTFCLALMIIVCNFLIDPFDFYHMPKIKGFNQIKTEIEQHSRLFKTIEIARQRPQAILLGTSRVMIGFNPDDLASILNLSTYNAGVGGASFEEIYRYFEQALYHQPDLKVVVIGLDMFAFNKSRKFELDAMPAQPQPLSTLLWHHLGVSLFSKAAFIGSYRTFKQNFFGTAVPIILPQGQINPLLLSKEFNALLVKDDLDFVKRMFSSSNLYRSYQLDERKVDMFSKIVQTCQQKDIQLVAFICPAKATYWEALYRKGLWPQIEAFKRVLSSMHPIWDFSGFNSVTTELIDSEESPLYFECSHFTPYTGKIILDKIFNRVNFPTDFGYLLTTDTREEIFFTLHQQRLEWVKKHPTQIKQIEQALLSIR